MKLASDGGPKMIRTTFHITESRTGRKYDLTVHSHSNPIINAWYQVTDSIRNYFVRKF